MSIVGTYTAQKFPAGYRQLEVPAPGDYDPTISLAEATGGIPAAATRAVIGVEGGSIRFRDDGGEPDTMEGFLITEGQFIDLPSRDAINAFRACALDEYGPSVLNINYYAA